MRSFWSKKAGGRKGLLVLMAVILSGCTVLRPNKWPKDADEVILTFDDGPTENTGKILDVLKKQRVKAVFCVIGKNVTKHPEMVRRMVEEGHVVANHSDSHRIGVLLSCKRCDEEIRNADGETGKALGDESFRTTYFRPPYGLLTPAVWFSREAKKRKTAYLTFFVDDSGAGPGNAVNIMERIKVRLKKDRGGAMVLHEQRYSPGSPKSGPSKDWLPGALDELITWVRENGMRFSLYEEENGL